MGDGNGEKDMEIRVECLEPQKPGCAAAVASFSVYRRRRGCDLKAAMGSQKRTQASPRPWGTFSTRQHTAVWGGGRRAGRGPGGEPGKKSWGTQGICVTEGCGRCVMVEAGQRERGP